MLRFGPFPVTRYVFLPDARVFARKTRQMIRDVSLDVVDSRAVPRTHTRSRGRLRTYTPMPNVILHYTGCCKPNVTIDFVLENI